jgi:hypothetical protein
VAHTGIGHRYRGGSEPMQSRSPTTSIVREQHVTYRSIADIQGE